MSYHHPVPSQPIASEKLEVERKVFQFDLKENDRGRFIKITEEVGGRRDTIMLPTSGAKAFHEMLGRLLEVDAKLAK
jgi:hypothetical protein